MAAKNLHENFELIQDTISNPDFRSKLTHILEEMSGSELAEIIESSPPQERKIIWDLIQLDAEGAVLGELDDALREELLKGMDPEEISKAISNLEADDLADILQTLPEKIIEEVLSLMNSRDRERVVKVLDYPEQSAGGLMNTDIITVRAQNTIELVSRYLKLLKQIPQNTDDIYVVNKKDEYIGVLPITKILTSDQSLTVRELMDTEFEPIRLETDQIEVFRLFQTNNLFSAPVVDKNNMLVGRITVDDIIEIGAEEAEQDFLGLAQIEEDLFSSTSKSIKSRLFWLTVNLSTAIIASFAISFFEDVLEKLIYAAILMPIVASMGGIAATQTLGIYIRAEAAQKLDNKSLRYIFRRELKVSVVNSIFFSVAIFGITQFWFSDLYLAIGISTAMIINLLAAAIFGFYLPQILRKYGFDPAISGGVLITTITDLVGFISFLGILGLLIV